MAIRDTYPVTVADGDQLDDGYFNGIEPEFFKHLGSDQTEGIMNGTTETEIGEVTVTANEVTTGILVVATGKQRGGGDYTQTIRLRAGTSATATSNTQYKSISRRATDNSDNGWAIVYFINDLTWSSTNFVHITGQHGNAASDRVTCESIEVIYL